MPLYEYFCQSCNGVFEELRPMREATEPVPCPECYRDAPRIMPTSFAAFTFRDGYPRRIPDDGKFYHLGHKVSKPVTGGRPNEHPEVNKPEPKKRKLKGEVSAIKDMQGMARKADLSDLYGNPVREREVESFVEQGRIIKQGTPNAAPD
ncbi:MAG: zinc ribbon domain-containing protein [Dehalococcoidia bacterium]|nr:zinc ribbon domain-containing protein [Dehalococcoidia bacterium]